MVMSLVLDVIPQQTPTHTSHFKADFTNVQFRANSSLGGCLPSPPRSRYPLQC